MTFTLINKKMKSKKKITWGLIIGYILPARNNKFIIEKTPILNIRVTNKKLAHPFVILQVNVRFQKLIDQLTDLLVSEDDSGEAMNIALNKIEFFRQLIKNEYRAYLKRKELEAMAKTLSIYQKEANKRLVELRMSMSKDNIGKSR